MRPVWGVAAGVGAAAVVAGGAFVALNLGSQSTTAAPAPVAESTPTPTPEPPRTLLSGRTGTDGQVLAVKLDNTRNSHPHAGLLAADVVYIEEVEWGLTRFMAVYSSKYPNVIGPVRSARETDLEILEQYGRVAFAFSGANPGVLRLVADAPLYPLSNDGGASGYSRNPERTAPWDLFADPEQLLKGAPKAVEARDVGFTFDEEAPPRGRPARQVSATWPDAEATFAWSKQEQRWLLAMDGEPAMSTEGPQLGGTTVIIQRVNAYPSSFGDRYGGVTPISETVGKGDAWLFRDGQVWPITWSRSMAERGTTWRYRGREIAFAPGQVWIVLLDDDRRPQIR